MTTCMNAMRKRWKCRNEPKNSRKRSRSSFGRRLRQMLKMTLKLKSSKRKAAKSLTTTMMMEVRSII